MIHPIRRTGAAAPQRQPSELGARLGLGGWQPWGGWIARRRSGGAQAWRTWVGALVVLPLLLSVAPRSFLAHDEGYYALQARWISEGGPWAMCDMSSQVAHWAESLVVRGGRAVPITCKPCSASSSFKAGTRPSGTLSRGTPRLFSIVSKGRLCS